MTSPYGQSGGYDPRQPWSQQPGHGGQSAGSPSDGFPAAPSGYGQSGPYGQPAYTGGGAAYDQPGYAQQYQPYGKQPGPGYPGHDQRYPSSGAASDGSRRKGGLLWVLVAAVVVVVVAVLVLGFVWPGWFSKKVFDSAAVQDGVKTILHDDYQLDVSSVSCPSGQEVKTGATFTCTATISGQQKQVQVIVRSDDGKYEVAQPK